MTRSGDRAPRRCALKGIVDVLEANTPVRRKHRFDFAEHLLLKPAPRDRFDRQLRAPKPA